jgi:hypothetical protein
MSDPQAELKLTVPLSVPTPERMEEIFREECAKAAAALTTWFDFKGAANYLGGMSLRTFERRKKAWGLPISELSAGLKIVYRADLDALALNNLVNVKAKNVIAFPSVAASELLKKGAA